MPVHDGGGEEPAIAMGSVGGLKTDSTSLARIINRVLNGTKLENAGSPSLNPFLTMNKSKNINRKKITLGIKICQKTAAH
jgi:hypothetical protein